MFKIIAGIVFALVAAIAITASIMIWVTEDFLRKASYLATVLVSFFACGLLIVSTGLVAGTVALVLVVTNLIDKKVNPLIDRVSPLLDKANETADVAKGTVTYVGEGVVSPLIKVSAILAAVRGGVGSLLRNRNS